MGDVECPPLIVEGDWSPEQNRTVKNKLQKYFQSKKRSGGGDCRVEAEQEGPTARLFFCCEADRKRVLQRKTHEITVENKTLTLRLSAAPTDTPVQSSTSSRDVSDLKPPESEPKPGPGPGPGPGSGPGLGPGLGPGPGPGCKPFLL
ncbi:poly [ADP-ribose] polymerase 14 [Austrofundulus limnaeus]|uniref:Poly [ADP-ribose] polymerase 14 n=1 Tax=Austrofundulus limnaeus TaxID=52670 RepID=A0A2I4BXQ4_AUSLI|nr:PREDICTED: poly [ADP-ribose] polymerase 14-like [Austrofundulus limnaeus]